MEFEKFPKPPIKEAIFTITFKNEILIDVLRQFSDLRSISEPYKIRKSSSVIHQQIKARTEQGHHDLQIKNLQDGYTLQDKDNAEKIIQAKTEAISFHKIQGYSGWDDLIEEFEFIVSELVKSSIDPIEIGEISVRYINHIPYNPAEGQLGEYFTLIPTEVPGIPSNLNNFFLQIGVSEGDKTAIITETIYNLKANPTFIIDLKVSKRLGTSLDDNYIWEAYKDIRQFKNRLFFSIITDKTKNLFK